MGRGHIRTRHSNKAGLLAQAGCDAIWGRGGGAALKHDQLIMSGSQTMGSRLLGWGSCQWICLALENAHVWTDP